MMFIAFTLPVCFLYYLLIMAGTFYKPLQNWLQRPSEHLGALLDQVHLLRRLTALLRRGLPEPLASHCLAANLEGGTLIIGCDSSAWAAKLRYQLPTLLALLRDHPDLPSLSQIRIRVQPVREEPVDVPIRRPCLSARNAAMISAMAESTNDPALKAALLRLSQRARPAQDF